MFSRSAVFFLLDILSVTIDKKKYNIRKAGLILGIHLIDHIIIGDNNFTSLNECGYLRQ